MHLLTNIVGKLRIRKDTRGQDLIEYALLAGLLVFGAGMALPALSDNVSKVFSRVTSVLTVAMGNTDGPGSSN